MKEFEKLEGRKLEYIRTILKLKGLDLLEEDKAYTKLDLTRVKATTVERIFRAQDKKGSTH